MQILLLLVPFFAYSTLAKDECQNGWMLIGDNCYKIFCDDCTRMDWYKAEEVCETNKATLANVKSDKQNTDITAKLDFTICGDKKRAWIGAKRYCPGEVFRWTDGEPLTTEKHFDPKPDDEINRCASIDGLGKWKPEKCSREQYSYDCIGAVCMKPKKNALPDKPVPKGETGDCDPKWCKYEDHCYSTFNTEEEFLHARDICTSATGDLASIHTEEENEFIYNISGSVSRDHKQIWIGFNLLTSADSKVFSWSDGSVSDYEHWNEGQPDNSNYFGVESCVQIFNEYVKDDYHPAWQGKWNDDRCDEKRSYVCKKAINGFVPTAHTTLAPKIGYCPDGWAQVGQRCVRYYPEQLSFEDAHNFCLNQSSKACHLFSIQNVYEQLFLQSYMRGRENHTWIGFFTDMYGRARWTDESPLTYTHLQTSYSAAGQAYYNGFSGYWIWVSSQSKEKHGVLCAQSSDPNLPPPAPTTSVTCPEHTLTFGDACYFFQTESKGWSEAESACQALGKGHLTSILDDYELAFLGYQAHVLFLDDLWIGLNSIGSEGFYHWIDGWPVLLSVWGAEEPDSSKGCTYMSQSPGADFAFVWKTDSCSSKRAFICKISSVPPPTVITVGSCPVDGRKWIEGSRECYQLNQTKIDWDGAYSQCGHLTGYTGTLANFLSPDDLNSVLLVLKSVSDRVFMGLIETGTNGWMWTSGMSMQPEPVTYTNWAPNQPGTRTQSEPRCGVMDQQGLWYAVSCTEQNMFMCEGPKLTPSSPLPPTSTTVPAVGSTSTSIPVNSNTTVTNNSTQPTTTPKSHHPLSPGAVAGIVIVVLLIVFACLIIGFLQWRRPQLLPWNNSSNHPVGMINPGYSTKDGL